jgi:hypothetical protein
MIFSSCKHRTDLSRSVRDFEESNQANGHISFFFYPSTIRMLNFENDTSFNALIKDIEKLKVLSFNNDKDSITPEQITILRNNIYKESFVDLLQMKQDNQQIMIFLRKENSKPREFLGIVYSGKNLTIVDLLGSIPISSLPSLINGKVKLSGLMSVFNNPRSIKQSKQKHEKRSSDN